MVKLARHKAYSRLQYTSVPSAFKPQIDVELNTHKVQGHVNNATTTTGSGVNVNNENRERQLNSMKIISF